MSKAASPTPAAEHLAELAWLLLAGWTLDLCRVVEVAGGTWHDYDGTVVVTREDGIRVGLAASDPCTAIVLTNFAVFGELWPLVPDACAAMQLVGRQEAARRRTAKRRAVPA